MPKWTPPTQAEVENYFTRLNNGGRWVTDNERGGPNLVTPEKWAAAPVAIF